MPDFKGKLVVFSAPSGSGKTTIVRHLLRCKTLALEFSISATSRKARGGEIDGKDYYFISLGAFKQKIKSDAFLEWEEVYINNFYGTLRSEVDRIWAAGKHVRILQVRVQLVSGSNEGLASVGYAAGGASFAES